MVSYSSKGNAYIGGGLEMYIEAREAGANPCSIVNIWTRKVCEICSPPEQCFMFP